MEGRLQAAGRPFQTAPQGPLFRSLSAKKRRLLVHSQPQSAADSLVEQKGFEPNHWSPQEKTTSFETTLITSGPFSPPKITRTFARGTGGSNPLCSAGESVLASVHPTSLAIGGTAWYLWMTRFLGEGTGG